MSEDREHRIRERAHRIWEQQGRPHGRHEDHWLQASQEIGDELFGQGGGSDAQERRGSLDGGLLPQGGLVAGGGPSGSGVGGLGMSGEQPPGDDQNARQQQGDDGTGRTDGQQG